MFNNFHIYVYNKSLNIDIKNTKLQTITNIINAYNYYTVNITKQLY